MATMNNAQEKPSFCDCPPHRRESVLTFDGGGIRGLVSLLILKHLLTFIRNVEMKHDRESLNAGASPSNPIPEETGMPLACHYFSFMFGTSTGGIIAIMLGRLRMGIDDCIHVYRDLGFQIFSKKQPFHFVGRNKYDCDKLKKIIQKIARKRGSLNNEFDPQREGPFLFDPSIIEEGDGSEQDRARNRPVPCRVGVFAVQRNFREGNTQKIHLFRSYLNPTPPRRKAGQGRHFNLENQEDVRIWEAARATSAAPTYFRSIDVNGRNYIDGGLMANNPSEHAWAEVHSMHRHHPAGRCPNDATEGSISFLVSLGTGKQADPRLRSGEDPLSRFRRLVALVQRGIQEMTNPERAHEWMEQDPKRKAVYHRFNVETGLNKMSLDECKTAGNFNVTFAEIQESVNRYVSDVQVWTRLQNLAEQLVIHRRQKCRAADQSFRGLCNPGPLQQPFDRRFRDDDPTRSYSNAGISPGGRVEMSATTPVGELQPRTPLQGTPYTPVQNQSQIPVYTLNPPSSYDHLHSYPHTPAHNSHQSPAGTPVQHSIHSTAPSYGPHDTPQNDGEQWAPPQSCTPTPARGRELGLRVDTQGPF